MKVISSILYILVYLNSSAQAFLVEIQDLSGNYKNSKGTATASNFKVEGFLNNSLEPVKITFEKKNNTIDINYNEEQFIWEHPPKLLLESESFLIKNINIKTYAQLISGNSSLLEFTSPKDYYRMNSFSLFCKNSARSIPAPADFLISSCTTQAKIKIKYLRYIDKTGKNILFKLMNRLFPSTQGEEVQNINIANFNLKTNNHNFLMTAQAQLKLRTKLSVKGGTWYDAKNKILKIRLDFVKISFLNITGKVFSELIKNQNDNLRVERPFIYLRNADLITSRSLALKFASDWNFLSE